MNKTYALVGILVVIILGAGYYVYSQEPAESNEMITSSTDEETETTDNTEPSAASPGIYKDYSESELASTTGTKLLFFHAPWCPQCRQLDESIKASTLPENTTIFKVDYDSNQELRQKYGVTIQTTVVKVDDSGNKIANYVAYQSPTFENVKAALLK